MVSTKRNCFKNLTKTLNVKFPSLTSLSLAPYNKKIASKKLKELFPKWQS